jgi:hypothetical protein
LAAEWTEEMGKVAETLLWAEMMLCRLLAYVLVEAQGVGLSCCMLQWIS